MTGGSSLHVDPTTGYLEHGRHRVTEADVAARFVDHADYAASTTRQAVWDDYELGRDLLRSKLRVHTVWIGGSFLTSKVDANDMDALFIISRRDFAQLSQPNQQVVASFLPPQTPGTVGGHGLNRLDSYLLPWDTWSPLDPRGGPDQLEYAAYRGYWDDFWQRDRWNKPDGKPPHWKDALPVRGYLEVELDAFSQ